MGIVWVDVCYPVFPSLFKISRLNSCAGCMCHRSSDARNIRSSAAGVTHPPFMFSRNASLGSPYISRESPRPWVRPVVAASSQGTELDAGLRCRSG